ncbi:alpha-L-fucosidase [Nonomuraea typhae]|uniref:alpha-L-fucosidase n=1 Tax=Nonomuraea typhae TaxID=2603600 RepID=UPI0012FA52F0|nr:alpha-L-fucosidase [Nonomuraea typhae]
MSMQSWFTQAKLGIFVHWGIYAVQGVAESWSFYDGTIGYDDYMKQADGFTGARFDAGQWSDLFAAAGARYAVLTAKHHDGFALWPTEWSRLRTERDYVGEYVAALRARGIHAGLYFSHLDWSHPDYASVGTGDNRFAFPEPGQEDPAAWERFLAFHRGQLRELQERYAPDLLWFDGDWERDAGTWRMAELREDLLGRQPEVVVNGRMQGFGDYSTPEQGVPITPPAGPWELCLTVNDSWGYQGHDDNHKSVRQIVRIFAETIGGGGNLLLDVGPREDGTITPEQSARLRELGDWIRPRAAAVYPTGRGLPPGHFNGASTLSEDRRRLYLFVFDRPNEFVVLRGVRNEVTSVRVLGTGRELRHERFGGLHDVPGWEYVYVSDDDLDPLCTVLEVSLDGELDVYRDHRRD